MSKFRSSLVFAMALGVAACGDDDPTGIDSGDPLTETEIQEVLSALFGAFGEAQFGGAAAEGPAAVTFSESIQVTAPCEGGGAISVNGNLNGEIDDVTDDLDFTYTLTMDPNACVVPTSSGTVTVDGDPSLSLSLDWMSTETDLTLDGTYDGGIAYSASDGRSGSCAFNLDFSADISLQGGTSTTSASGTVCGVQASQFQTITF